MTPTLARRSTYIALLRSINVGGRNKLSMKDLAAIFLAAQCTDVRTYIQSGNVVFNASEAVAERIPALVSSAITERFGFTVPVVLRTLAEFDDVSRDNPFLKSKADSEALHVAFLNCAPNAQHSALLNPKRSPADEFAVCGKDIYLFLPNGVARTKLTNAFFDRTLHTTCTIRNWRTVLNVLAMAKAVDLRSPP